MITGGAGGGASLAQGTAAARPATPASAFYFATDTGELSTANAGATAWQAIAATSAAVFTAGVGLVGATLVGNNKINCSGGGTGNIGLFGSTLTGLTVLANGTLQNNVATNEVATATAGSITSPGNFQGFLVFQDHNGTARKIPYFAT